MYAASPRTETSFFVVGGVVFCRVPSEILPFFVPRSVSPSAVRLSVRVPRSMFQHLMFKRTLRRPPAFRVPTYKNLTPCRVSVSPRLFVMPD